MTARQKRVNTTSCMSPIQIAFLLLVNYHRIYIYTVTFHKLCVHFFILSKLKNNNKRIIININKLLSCINMKQNL